MLSNVVQSSSCALEQEFSFPFRVFIPSFLVQTQLSGGQQDFLLQVPINQDYNFFFFLFSLKIFPAACGTSWHPLSSITHLMLWGLEVSSDLVGDMCLFISLRSVFFLEAEFCKQSRRFRNIGSCCLHAFLMCAQQSPAEKGKGFACSEAFMEALNLSESFLDELNLSSEGTTVHKGELKTFAGCQRRFSLIGAVGKL